MRFFDNLVVAYFFGPPCRVKAFSLCHFAGSLESKSLSC